MGAGCCGRILMKNIGRERERWLIRRKGDKKIRWGSGEMAVCRNAILIRFQLLFADRM